MKLNAANTVKMIALTGIALTVSLAGAQTRPNVPNWVRPGLQVVYDSGSRFMGPHAAALTLLETIWVDSVNSGTVSGRVNMRNGGNPLQNNFNFSCITGSNCDGYPAQFWIDIQNPTASIHGPNGEPFSVVGRNNVNYGGRTWDATTMAYQNPASGTQFVVTYDNASGLILAYSESSPAQQVFRHIRSISGR
jgi:hypothetical protein